MMGTIIVAIPCGSRFVVVSCGERFVLKRNECVMAAVYDEGVHRGRSPTNPDLTMKKT